MEDGVGPDLGAALLSDMLEVIENLAKTRKTNLDTVGLATSALLDLVTNLNHSWVQAKVSKAMEDGSGHVVALDLLLLGG